MSIIIRGNTVFGPRLIKSAVTPTIVTSGLILNLDAGNAASYSGSGTTWTDLSGNGNNGTLINGVSYSSLNGGTLVFDGVNDYVRASNLGITGNSSITINLWASRLTDTSGDQVFMMYGPAGGGTSSGIYYRGSDNFVRFTNWGPNDFSTSFTKDTNVWHYWSIVYDTLGILIYRDGVADIGGKRLFTINFSNSNIGIGATEGGSNFTNIQSNMCHVYNRALTGIEVLQNYDATKSRF